MTFVLFKTWVANKIESLVWDEIVKFLTTPRILKDMRVEIENKNKCDSFLEQAIQRLETIGYVWRFCGRNVTRMG